MAIGGGDYMPEIQQLVKELNLQDRVIFKGMMPIEELPKVLSSADVGLVPNRESSVTHLMLPVKLLEFAMMGIPSISAKLKTVEYYFGNGAVRFFKPGDVSELANAIEQLYRSPELRKQYAETARKVVDHFSWPKQRAEFYRAIDSIVPRRETANAVHAEKRHASAAGGR
jgi:glycosyltransferase involved in cell wall biosynthesis